MAARVFEYQHRVIYAECTVGNHVYYANYLPILEEARGELVRALGNTCLELQEQEIIFPVVECSLRYKFPARYDDVLTVAVSVNELKGARLNFGYRVTNQRGQLVLEGETHHVCTNLADKPRRIPPALGAKLAPFLRAPATPLAGQA